MWTHTATQTRPAKGAGPRRQSNGKRTGYVCAHRGNVIVQGTVGARLSGGYHDSVDAAYKKQRECEAEGDAAREWAEWAGEPEWRDERNADTLRMLREKVRQGKVDVAFHRAQLLSS